MVSGPLKPVALKTTATFKAFALLEDGYVQSTDSIECPLCREKYILLFDRADAGRVRVPPSPLHEEAVRYFQKQIREAHETGHVYDRLVMV